MFLKFCKTLKILNKQRKIRLIHPIGFLLAVMVIIIIFIATIVEAVKNFLWEIKETLIEIKEDIYFNYKELKDLFTLW